MIPKTAAKGSFNTNNNNRAPVTASAMMMYDRPVHVPTTARYLDSPFGPESHPTPTGAPYRYPATTTGAGYRAHPSSYYGHTNAGYYYDDEEPAGYVPRSAAPYYHSGGPHTTARGYYDNGRVPNTDSLWGYIPTPDFGADQPYWAQTARNAGVAGIYGAGASTAVAAARWAMGGKRGSDNA